MSSWGYHAYPWIFFRCFGAPPPPKKKKKKSCGITNMATYSNISFFDYFQAYLTSKRWNFYKRWYIHFISQVFLIFRKNLFQDHSSKLSDHLYFKPGNWLLKTSDPDKHHTSGQISGVKYARMQLYKYQNGARSYSIVEIHFINKKTLN